jgi:hypothetical protein
VVDLATMYDEQTHAWLMEAGSWELVLCFSQSMGVLLGRIDVRAAATRLGWLGCQCVRWSWLVAFSSRGTALRMYVRRLSCLSD